MSCPWMKTEPEEQDTLVTFCTLKYFQHNLFEQKGNNHCVTKTKTSTEELNCPHYALQLI